MNAFSEPSSAIKRFGTEEPVTAPRLLKAGSLTAEFDGGNLRHIRLGDLELIRAISFIVRDHNWGTYNPTLENVDIQQDDTGFSVSYDALARDDRQAFRFQAQIRGTAQGSLTFAAQGVSETDFLTNRTGFVVLHPCALAGQAVTIEHTDGNIEHSQFPEAINPLQPMLDLRCLTHEAAPGLHVRCLMLGDTYEMEDQRNWTDASYKTYTRPLALPWPYTLRKGEHLEQSVQLSIQGKAPSISADRQEVHLSLGARAHALPPLGVGLQPQDIADTQRHAPLLQKARVGHVIGFYDPREGHNAETLQALAKTADMLGASAWLEAVVTSVPHFAEELAALGQQVDALGSPFPTVLVSPAPDLKCTLPGSEWPPAPDPRAFFKAARAAFPKARLGGGMFSLFTEMNRKRPPMDLIDFLSFTTTAMLHAGDDLSIMEGLESLPAMALTATEIASGKPWAVGPSALGLRMNPYGEAPFANPDNIRQAMNFNDPRHRALLGAAWALGLVARFAYGGASAITLGGATGPFGLVYSRQAWPQPWYDDIGKGFFPMYHVVRGLASRSGSRLRAVQISLPTRVQAIALELDTGATELWVANLSGEPTICRFDHAPTACAILDEDSFASAAQDADALEHLPRVHNGLRMELGPYAIARLTLP